MPKAETIPLLLGTGAFYAIGDSGSGSGPGIGKIHPGCSGKQEACEKGDGKEGEGGRKELQGKGEISAGNGAEERAAPTDEGNVEEQDGTRGREE